MSNKTPIITYKCPVCKYEFGKKAECLEHMKEHETDKELCSISLYWHCKVGWSFSCRTWHVRQAMKAEDIIRMGNDCAYWHIEVENNPASILDAKKRLKATALRYFHGQAGLIAKLNVEDGEK